jgi:hypothetical protein
MSFEQHDAASHFSMSDHPNADDGNGPLALAAGLAAGLVAGGLWALLVRLTNYEIGYAAWGVGLLVGWAMTRVTQRRTPQLACAAAGFAIIGLVAGKAFIFASSGAAIAGDFVQDDELMASYVAWNMYENRELDAATLEELDATQAAGDTLSDRVWEAMRGQASARVAAMSPQERLDTAQRAADETLRGFGLLGGITAQLTFLDLLWLFLAVGTAYRMLAPAREQEPAAMQPA